jgi:hypothetical protein
MLAALSKGCRWATDAQHCLYQSTVNLTSDDRAAQARSKVAKMNNASKLWCSDPDSRRKASAWTACVRRRKLTGTKYQGRHCQRRRSVTDRHDPEGMWSRRIDQRKWLTCLYWAESTILYEWQTAPLAAGHSQLHVHSLPAPRAQHTRLHHGFLVHLPLLTYKAIKRRYHWFPIPGSVSSWLVLQSLVLQDFVLWWRNSGPCHIKPCLTLYCITVLCSLINLVKGNLQ